jgi:hypothetical protein
MDFVFVAARPRRKDGSLGTRTISGLLTGTGRLAALFVFFRLFLARVRLRGIASNRAADRIACQRDNGLASRSVC